MHDMYKIESIDEVSKLAGRDNNKRLSYFYNECML